MSFIIADKKQKVREELRKIHRAIRQMEELADLTFVEDKVLDGFNWSRNFGGSECWLAVYEKNYENHRVAPRFSIYINEDKIIYGLVYGEQHPNYEVNQM